MRERGMRERIIINIIREGHILYTLIKYSYIYIYSYYKLKTQQQKANTRMFQIKIKIKKFIKSKKLKIFMHLYRLYIYPIIILMFLFFFPHSISLNFYHINNKISSTTYNFLSLYLSLSLFLCQKYPYYCQISHLLYIFFLPNN